MDIKFTVGELAKLHNLSKQTLIFYDKIGLFKPKIIDSNNNYRYYTSEQLEVLDSILILREIGIPIKEIKEFHKKGIELVVISLGKDGSIAGFNGKFYKVTVPKVNAVNPVGSGDSYVAGIALGLQKGFSIEDVLKYASACGTANAVEEETGFVNKEVVEELFNKITVDILEA